MHESVLAFVELQVKSLDLADKRTLEVGSADVNGSVRQFWTGPYLGIDLAPGPGVDLVVPGGLIPLPNDYVDVIVSTEALEHDPRPWVTLTEMARLLIPGGTLLLTCRGFDERGAFPHHNAPDLYRYSMQALRVLAEDAGFDVEVLIPDPQVIGFFMRSTLSLPHAPSI